MFANIVNIISVWAIPMVVALIALYAIIKKVPVYSVFTEGAKEGFSTAVMIIPYLVAMLCAIGMFRASGALLFGLRGFHKGFLQVEPCMKLHTRISQIHEIKSGEGVGYDYLWRASRDTRVGTLPIGYADGYPRNMRGKGYATVDGVKCPIIGVICMDQCMIDLGPAPQAREGDQAIIYGDGRENTMSIQEAANLADTNKNEIISRIAKRVIRVYNDI